MLEDVGATVLLPRGRDWQTTEIIIDNDGRRDGYSIYAKQNGSKVWSNRAKTGFAHLRATYENFGNPFCEGSYRQTETIKKETASIAEWIPAVPRSGRYVVYVSYKTVDNSTDDVLYVVYYQDGTSQLKVNQQMEGGTWIYLGTFGFSVGKTDHKVVLSNQSSKTGCLVTADAVKVSGGYGNIAHSISGEGGVDYPYEVSNYPRLCEATRCWMQWAGILDSVYSDSRGKNDYTDDYKSRGIRMNYLAGGSAANPTEKGLNILIDMAFAFHSDVDTTYGDTIIGTLGIFQVSAYDGIYANDTSRYVSRDLCDLIQSNIVKGIRTLHEPEWICRGVWNQSYYEARVLRVPTMLLEFLPHQNFADMRYGLDPRFRFTISCAIYKGMLQFLCSQYKMDYAIQPLSVGPISLRFIEGNRIILSRQLVDDPPEPTAKVDRYIVYTHTGEGDFDNGVIVDTPDYRTNISSGAVCSFKVAALNKGGESSPSEILSIGKALDEKGTALVMNGSSRVSGPADFTADVDTLAGFLDELNHGVSYQTDISYTGPMKEFRRQIPWMDDDVSGFGDSYGTYETMVIVGNSFDYPTVHGEAILKVGYSSISCGLTPCSSLKKKNGRDGIANQTGIASGDIPVLRMNDYKYADLILGEQCQSKMGWEGVKPLELKTFSGEVQNTISGYCRTEGNFFVSGTYVALDLRGDRLVKADEKDKKFVIEVLRYKWRTGQAARNGKVKGVASPFSAIKGNYTYHQELNPELYVVESPDAIEPAIQGAFIVLRYSENNLSAGIAYKGDYKTCILGFPFESIRTPEEREQLTKIILALFGQ